MLHTTLWLLGGWVYTWYHYVISWTTWEFAQTKLDIDNGCRFILCCYQVNVLPKKIDACALLNDRTTEIVSTIFFWYPAGCTIFPPASWTHPSQVRRYFHSLEVVDRVSETQLQVGENIYILTAQCNLLHVTCCTLSYRPWSARV